MQPLPAKKKTIGQINIDYTINCPHCGHDHDDYYDREWFEKTVGSDFPVDDGYSQTFEATCKECKQEFEINGFQY